MNKLHLCLLGWLTAADYSTGNFYHYSYDPVGNRLTQEKSVNGQITSDAYEYDIANRLTSVNGVNYNWGNNGNLLSDGANHLAAIQNRYKDLGAVFRAVNVVKAHLPCG